MKGTVMKVPHLNVGGKRVFDVQQHTVTLMDEIRALEPYIYYIASTGSVYLKFSDARLGSVRVADHEGREKYEYRWNLVPVEKPVYIRTDSYERWYDACPLSLARSIKRYAGQS